VHDQRRRPDLLLLAVAVAAVSTSAPLIREAAAPALLIAFWRTALATGVLAPFARPESADPTNRRRIVLAGMFLAAHFAAWISSLSFTSVSSSVALVATQPVWAALLTREHVDRRVWTGIAVALAGAVAITGVDVSVSGRAVFGDLLALAGAVLAAGYVLVGAEVRRSVPTATYAAGCYGTSAVILLVAALASGTDLVPDHAATWGWIVAITVGPQLLGHTLINAVLQRLGAVLVSVSILFEIVGASLLAWWWFGERPPAATYPAAGLLVVGLVLVMRRPLPAAVD
jgi:drug/metabolite transporter (DMT)-like permease